MAIGHAQGELRDTVGGTARTSPPDAAATHDDDVQYGLANAANVAV